MFNMLATGILCGRDVEIEIGAITEGAVSPYLTGMNAVYSHESMNTWSDGLKASRLKDAGIRCLRYPGGHVVSFWDWEFPYHAAYQSFWDPAYMKSLTPQKQIELKQKNGHRMVLEDFFQVCNDADLEPLMGINMFQGYKFNRLEDSIAKAVRLLEHCMKQNPRVQYYYLDNEAGHQPEKGNHIPIDDYISLIPAYSKAIKAVQPDAKLIVNPIQWGRVGDMIKTAGAHFDIVDTHWYYSNRKWGLFHIEDWRKENKNREFGRKAAQFKNWKKETGHEHLRLAVLEWNLGLATGAGNSDPSSYLFQGLVQADMLMQFINHDVSMAAAWPLMWAPHGRSAPGGYRNFFDPQTGEASSSRHIFRWFSIAGGGALLTPGNPGKEGIHSTAVIQEDGKSILVYVLNKSADSRNVTIRFRKQIASASASSFEAGNNVNDVRVTDIAATASGETVTFRASGTSFVFMEAKLH